MDSGCLTTVRFPAVLGSFKLCFHRLAKGQVQPGKKLNNFNCLEDLLLLLREKLDRSFFDIFYAA